MTARMHNPGAILPDATKAMQELIKATFAAGVPHRTMELVHLRTSQINGCSYCVNSASQAARRAGETDERLFGTAAWREAPWFDDAERSALDLAEAMARLSDRPDPVPDALWEEASRHFDERQLPGLVLWIATANLFNRINVTTRQPAGEPTWS